MEKETIKEQFDHKSSINEEKTPAESKMKRLGDYALKTLKEMVRSLRYPEFKFAISGIVITVILTLISLAFFIVPYFFTTQTGTPGIQLLSFVIPANLFGVLISIIIAIFIIYLWFLLGIKITPTAAHYLVDNKILKLFFTKGQVHYLEYVPEEQRKIAMPHVLNKYIALLIAWVSVSAFLLNLVSGLFAGGDPGIILNPGNDIFLFLIRSFILFLAVPLVFTFIYPLGWMLIDARLKAYNSGSKLNWLIGKKVANLTGGVITFGSLFALGADVIGKFSERAQLMVDLVLFCIINVSLTVILISLFYNVFFQGKFYQLIIDSIEIGFGISSVTLVDSEGNPIPELKSDSVTEPKPEFKEIKPEIETKRESEHEDNNDY